MASARGIDEEVYAIAPADPTGRREQEEVRLGIPVASTSSRAENEDRDLLSPERGLVAQSSDTLLVSSAATSENLRWSFTENTEARDFATFSRTDAGIVWFEDGMIPLLDDGQIPVPRPQQHLGRSGEQGQDHVSNYLGAEEADLRRNLEGLLAGLQSQAIGGMALDVGENRRWQQEVGDVSYIDPRGHGQYRDPTIMGSPVPFGVTDHDEGGLQPVTCTFGTMRDGSLSFVSRDFRWFEAVHFPDALNSQAEESVGMMFLTITNWQPWFLANLKSAVPTFPVQSVLHLSDNSPVTKLPVMDRYLSEMSCMTEHIDLAMDGDREAENGLNIGSHRTKSRPFAVWTAARDALPHHASRPLIVVATKGSENIVSKIAGHYVQIKNGQVSHVRWERMRANQTWVYLDLYNLFTKWDNVWEAVKSNLNSNLVEIHSDRRAITVKERTKQLHFGHNVMITLRECLRAHKASLKIVVQRNSNSSDQQYWQSSEILSARLDDAQHLLEYYDQLAGSLLDQQQNLLNLSSTLENVSQSQSISNLNSLALVFLPISLVASIFGFNTITVSPKYFPAAAVPALILTIVIAYIANKLMSPDSRPSSNSKDTRHDLEKLPVHRSVSTFNYPTVQRGASPWHLPRNILRFINPAQTPTRSPLHPSSTNMSAPSPFVPTTHVRTRESFHSAHASSSPYVLRRDPNSDSDSAQTSGNSLPRLPHLPIINPLWPPTTFPSFDRYEAPTSAMHTPTRTGGSASLHPSSASSKGKTPIRHISPSMTIRRVSSNSPPPNTPAETATEPELEAEADICTSPAMIETLETAFPPPIPLRHPRSSTHIGFQLAEGSQSGSGGAIVYVPRVIVEPTPEASPPHPKAHPVVYSMGHSDTEPESPSIAGGNDSGGDLVPISMIATGMGDITPSVTDTEEEGEGEEVLEDFETSTQSERSSSEMGMDERIDYAEIARRQAEAFGFGVGYEAGEAAAAAASAASASVSASASASVPLPESCAAESVSVERTRVYEAQAQVQAPTTQIPATIPMPTATVTAIKAGKRPEHAKVEAETDADNEVASPISPVFSSFGDQQLLLDALQLQASRRSPGPGYVGRLVSRFEAGSSPPLKSPGTPGSMTGVLSGRSSPVVLEAGMYVVERRIEYPGQDQVQVQTKGLGLGIYDPSSGEEEEHVDLYSAEEDDETSAYTPPRQIDATESKESPSGSTPRPEIQTPIPIQIPVPMPNPNPMPTQPRHSSHFSITSRQSRPYSMVSVSAPSWRTDVPSAPNTPPPPTPPPHTYQQPQVEDTGESEEEMLARTDSASSDDSAVTARTRPVESMGSREELGGMARVAERAMARGLYDRDGFYESPRASRSVEIRDERQQEHAVHPGGLAEGTVLQLLDDDESVVGAGDEEEVRRSWANSERWRRMQEVRDAIEEEEDQTARRPTSLPRPHAPVPSSGERSSSEYTRDEESEEMSETASEEETGSEDQESEEDAGMDVERERAMRLLIHVGLGSSAGNRASAASGGSYSRGVLDTIFE